MILESHFIPDRLVRNPHVQTITPTLFRRVPRARYRRERIETPDNDFLDLDWLGSGNGRVAIVSHGLEGCSDAVYARAMARFLFVAGWDVVVWNFRGCSGEPNRHPFSYHSGKSEDLAVVVEHVKKSHYNDAALIGFSIGGNITLKYLGELGAQVPHIVRAAVAISVPCDLASAAERLRHWSNSIYLRRFLLSLRKKVRQKSNLFPEAIGTSLLPGAWDFHTFDERYTAPLNGYANAQEYWKQASCLPALSAIAVPTLLLNAIDDPFLTPACFPEEQARVHHHFHLEASRWGGHVGFMYSAPGGKYYSEERTLDFLHNVMSEGQSSAKASLRHRPAAGNVSAGTGGGL